MRRWVEKGEDGGSYGERGKKKRAKKGEGARQKKKRETNQRELEPGTKLTNWGTTPTRSIELEKFQESLLQ